MDGDAHHPDPGGAVGAPDPSSTAVALPAASLIVPDPPTFGGPTHATLWATQWTAPLLIASGLYVMGAQGSLTIGLFLLGTASSALVAGAARLWLLARRRALGRAARRFAHYASSTLGDAHEATRRARDACETLEIAELVRAWDPLCITRVEQGLWYTRELLEMRQLEAQRR